MKFHMRLKWFSIVQYGAKCSKQCSIVGEEEGGICVLIVVLIVVCAWFK